MDYQLNIYPSAERELLNVRADNNTKQIKVLSENKLPAMYKKSFGAAVKKYNERAISGKLIDNYYKSILESNIPEVYKLSLIIRYELLNKAEVAAIQKAFLDFKKLLEKEPTLVVVSSYLMSYDEYKELQIFFYPVSEGYATGLVTRNDLIDVTKKLCETKDNLNLIQAMPLFTAYIEKMFATVNGGQFISQEELEAQARNIKEEDPMTLHAIAVETLKAQMNALQKINAENQQLEAAVDAQKQRIQHELVWIKETEVKIHEAEIARIEEEKRLAEEARREEARRREEEAQRREIERLREEERRIEAARLAEQARRNIELRKQMAKQDEELKRHVERRTIDQATFERLIEQHLKWQEFYRIDETVEYDKIPVDAANDPRRLTLLAADVRNVEFAEPVVLIGVTLNDCEFTECTLPISLTAASIANCTWLNSTLSDVSIKKSILNNVNIERLDITDLKCSESTVIKACAKGTFFTNAISAASNNFIKCDFANATFRGCDVKRNVFTNCDFDNATFAACDVREAVFRGCNTDTIFRENSVFRGAKFSET